VDDVAKVFELAPSLRQRSFPSWHFWMLNDTDRNSALENMVAGLDLREKTVLEIGTGCGLVALLFAKYGAEHVHTCEINSDLADIATAIIGATTYRDRITVYRKSSAALVRSASLPRSPDIIFTETLDCGVVGEGFFSISQDICRIAGAQTQVLPLVVRQFGILVEASDLRKLNEVDFTCSFNLSALNFHSTRTYYPIREQLHEYTALTDTFHIRDYSYLSCKPPAPVILSAARSGIADGVISWFEAQFGNVILSNRPGTRGHWHQAFHPLPTRTSIDARTCLQLTVDDRGRIDVSGL
jgi:type II protein arginine methyltransferase